jgi:hypothetical protein
MSQKLNSKVAVIGIDIGKNSFHIVQKREGGEHPAWPSDQRMGSSSASSLLDRSPSPITTRGHGLRRSHLVPVLAFSLLTPWSRSFHALVAEAEQPMLAHSCATAYTWDSHFMSDCVSPFHLAAAVVHRVSTYFLTCSKYFRSGAACPFLIGMMVPSPLR